VVSALVLWLLACVVVAAVVLSPLLSHPAMARTIVNQAKRFASRIIV
jgi:hypothetical protein